MAITEVFCAPVKPGSTPEEQVQILRSQAPVGNISWGYVIDEPPTLQAFIDWDSLEAHSIFNASDVFPELMQGFQSMFAGIPSLSHVEFKPSPEAQEKALTAPVTEVITFYFSGSPPQAFLEKAMGFRDVLAQQKGFVEVAAGVTNEEFEYDGKHGKAVVALVGWETKQDYETFRDSETLKENGPDRWLENNPLLGRKLKIASLQKY